MGAGGGEGVAAGGGRAVVLGEGDRADAVQGAFHGAADGAGVEGVLGDVVAAVHPREDEVGGRVLEDFVQAGEDAVGGRALDGEAAGTEALQAHRADVGDAVRDARLLEGGGDGPDLAHLPGKRGGDLLGDGEARRADAVVVGEKDAHGRPLGCFAVLLGKRAPGVQPERS